MRCHIFWGLGWDMLEWCNKISISELTEYIIICVQLRMMKNFRNKHKLDKIAEVSNSEATKQQNSPLRTSKDRIMMGGMGDSYLSFFKMESQTDKQTKPISEFQQYEPKLHSIVEKDQMISTLQDKIMKETVKKNARERCFQERVSADWRDHLEEFLIRLVRICVEFAKGNRDHRANLLKVLHRCVAKKDPKDSKSAGFVLLSWILQWLQPVLKMLHQTVRRKYA